MVKVFCDRCGAPTDRAKNLWEMAQTMNNGVYLSNLFIVKDGDNKEKDYYDVDLCDNCQKEFEQLIITFMSTK